MNFRLLFLAILPLLFVGCSDDDDSPVTRPTQTESFLRIVHASNSVGSTDIYGSYLGVKSLLWNNATQGNAFPSERYLALEASLPPDEGESLFWYFVQAHPDAADTNNVFLLEDLAERDSFRLGEVQYQTLWLVDSAGAAIFVFTTDDSIAYTAADTARALVRFVNLSTADTYRLTSNGSYGPSSSVGFGQATAYSASDIGTVTFEVEASDGSVVTTQATTLQPRKSVTLYYTGSNLRRLNMD